jgi:hypothetical protein
MQIIARDIVQIVVLFTSFAVTGLLLLCSKKHY